MSEVVTIYEDETALNCDICVKSRRIYEVISISCILLGF
jgi:hypothetical protein